MPDTGQMDGEMPDDVDIAGLLRKVNQGLHICFRCGADAPVIGATSTPAGVGGMINLARRCVRCGWTAIDSCGIGPLVPRSRVCTECGGTFRHIPGSESEPAHDEGDRPPVLRCDGCGAPGTPDMLLLNVEDAPTIEQAESRMRERLAAGDYHRALGLANYVLVHDFQNKTAWELKQWVLQQAGLTGALLAMLEEGLRRGGPVSLNRQYGHQLYKQKRLPEAAAAYRAYLASDESFALEEVCLGLANTLRFMEPQTQYDKDDVKRLYQQAISLAPGALLYRRAYISYLWAEGHYAAALERIESTLPLASTAEETCSMLLEAAEIQRLSGNWEGAISACTRVLEVDPNRVEALYLRGFSFGQLGQFHRAKEDSTRVLELDPEHPGALQMRHIFSIMFPAEGGTS